LNDFEAILVAWTPGQRVKELPIIFAIYNPKANFHSPGLKDGSQIPSITQIKIMNPLLSVLDFVFELFKIEGGNLWGALHRDPGQTGLPDSGGR